MHHPTPEDEKFLTAAVELAARSRQGGNHPFGSLLVLDGSAVLEAGNSVVTGRDATGHAETNLVRLATRTYTREELAKATLYTSTEPCAMCAGAVYWSGIGRVVYALGEDELLALTGANEENPTMALPCREVFAAGQRPIEVVGPCLRERAEAVHAGFWN
ncbi:MULTISPECIES: nucleoside deaminase [unclassified Streptomyces]|uniref:nucleoside deaminase n=1 Tax=unclassified Streptomyces TaxID=2593676 RepID=UPI002E808A6C|nr:nucleoside deaminase [Streptomyces sp. NBC_00589]WTI37170.1 nucleoside deaminase [Streptomyces sp. NBC_00775]WUB29154.1 nucleoside deaminase [Streptomyces sp. NBC_00589]